MLAGLMSRWMIRLPWAASSASASSAARLALKPFDRARIPRQLFGEEFQRDGASQPRVFGQVDDAHAALTQFFQDVIVRDGLADHPVVV